MNARHALPLLLLGFGLLGNSAGSCAGDVQSLQKTCADLDSTGCAANPACAPGGGTAFECEPVDGCVGLDEPSCIAEAVCEPVYTNLPCACAPCEDPDNCDDCLCADAEVYDSCQPIAPTCGPVCEIACEYGKQTDSSGCEICACNPPPPPPICEPLGCRLACEFGYVLDDHGCDTCECLPPPPMCGSDADCQNSVCIPGSFHGDVFHCFRADCSDGTELGCRQAEPLCPAGLTYSIVNGCYGPCVDALSCELPLCDDGSDVFCNALPPECGPGEVNTIANGCWGPCVDSDSCR